MEAKCTHNLISTKLKEFMAGLVQHLGLLWMGVLQPLKGIDLIPFVMYTMNWE